MPERYNVRDPAHSECGSALLDSLNWSNWWTDTGGYIHVARMGDATVHRVFCRHSECPRLLFQAGALYWLVDEAKPAAPKEADDRMFVCPTDGMLHDPLPEPPR